MAHGGEPAAGQRDEGGATSGESAGPKAQGTGPKDKGAGGKEEASVKARPSANGTHHGANGSASKSGAAVAEPVAPSPKPLKIDGNGGTQKQQEQFAGFQTDAPALR